MSSELKKQIQSARLAKKLTQAQVGGGSAGRSGCRGEGAHAWEAQLWAAHPWETAPPAAS